MESCLIPWWAQCRLLISITGTCHHISNQSLRPPDHLYHKRPCPFLIHHSRPLLRICPCGQCSTHINLTNLHICRIITQATPNLQHFPCIINRCQTRGRRDTCKAMLQRCLGHREWEHLVLCRHMLICIIRRGPLRFIHYQTTSMKPYPWPCGENSSTMNLGEYSSFQLLLLIVPAAACRQSVQELGIVPSILLDATSGWPNARRSERIGTSCCIVCGRRCCAPINNLTNPRSSRKLLVQSKYTFSNLTERLSVSKVTSGCNLERCDLSTTESMCHHECDSLSYLHNGNIGAVGV